MVITLFLILKTGTQNWTPYKTIIFVADRFRICIIDIGSRDYGINIVILNDNIMKMKRTFITAFFATIVR